MDDVYVRAPAHTRFPALNLILFLTTVATTLASGFVLAIEQTGAMASVPAPEGLRLVLAAAWAGVPYAGSLVGILLSHEMGHYLLARRHRVDATLPFFVPFLPFPFGVGTLGAVIRIRSLMPSRRAVLDIGVAGPIAGFVVAVPLLIWGYAHSPVSPYQPAGAPMPSAVNYVRHLLGLVPSPSGEAMLFGRSLLSMAALHLTHPGLPVGTEVTEHPVAIAGWFGLYVTTINLLPIGQLDGGHVLYALLGRERARLASQIVSWALLGLGVFVSWTWLAWWAITRAIVGNRHPPALEEEPLGPGRRLVAVLAFVIFAVTFTPVPIS
jgi:membrane-associated protease RseP (regulator of RpoE activity)